MTYEETKELEENIKITKEAERLYNDFIKKFKLDACKYLGDFRFRIWSDSHNDAYAIVKSDGFKIEYRFLHESYDVHVNPSFLFKSLKEKYRGMDHFKSYVDYDLNKL